MTSFSMETLGLVLVSVALVFPTGHAQVVKTDSGALLGTTETSRIGRQYYAFKGIPFAERPTRFKVAKPVKPWGWIRNAREYGPRCMQVSLISGPAGQDFTSGSEDCLYLNVFTPADWRCQNETSRGGLPVLFHIHGGAFTLFSGDLMRPAYLMDECIVYVNTNYRLGALGFLTTEDGVIPGNLGLKDALLALKWVNQNIGYFRGDKDLITINGISAGGASVSHFIASPAAKGLFQRAIAQSGSSLAQWAISKGARERAFQLGRHMNCTMDSSEELLVCLQSMKATDLMLTQERLKYWQYDILLFGPVVEPEGAVAPFQTKDPYVLFARGDVNRVPLITGTMGDEGMPGAQGILEEDVTINELNRFWKCKVPASHFFDFLNVTDDSLTDIRRRIRQFYWDGGDVIPEKNGQGFRDSMSDRLFNHPSYEEAVLYSRYSSVYRYVMTFGGDGGGIASHGKDAQYLSNIPLAPAQTPGSRSLEFSRKFIRLWVSFMRTGVPSATWNNVSTWEPFKPDAPNTLKLDLPSQMLPHYWSERMQFWDNLSLRELQFPQAG